MYMFSHTVIPLGKMVVGTFEFHSKGSIIKGWQGGWHCLSTGCVEGTVICVPCSPNPIHTRKSSSKWFHLTEKGAGAGTQWGLAWSHIACRFELVWSGRLTHSAGCSLGLHPEKSDCYSSGIPQHGCITDHQVTWLREHGKGPGTELCIDFTLGSCKGRGLKAQSWQRASKLSCLNPTVVP